MGFETMKNLRQPLALACSLVGLSLLAPAMPSAQDEGEGPALGPPPLSQALTTGPLEAAGRIRNGRLTIDRFEFDLADGDLYLLTQPDGRPAVAVFLGDGTIRCYPPDGVEHQQLERFLDNEDMLEEAFDRFVFWFSDDTGARLRALADDTARHDLDDAHNVLEDRREALLDDQLSNPDARLFAELLRPEVDHGDRFFFHAEVDSHDHGWLSVEIEPMELEEVRLFRFDEGHETEDVWMRFHALSDFGDHARRLAFSGFQRDPVVDGKLSNDADDDDDDWSALDLGLSPRPLPPEEEGWTRRVAITRTDVDLRLENDGTVQASAAVLVEPREPITTLRLLVSPVLEVTDVRWLHTAPGNAVNVRDVSLLPGESTDPEEPVSLVGEPLRFVRGTHKRRLADDLHEPWVTIALPRTMYPDDTFVVELAYEGELIEYLRDGSTYVLKDPLYWLPTHPDTRSNGGSQLRLTYRMPDRFSVASGSTLVDEQVVDKTRIMRWVADEPVRSMSFNLGRFDVTDVRTDDGLLVTLYSDRNHRGFAPGNKEKTLADLTGAIRTYTEYFGPYLFDSLLVTEAPTYNALAFPGLVLLSFQAFGGLYTGEAELFRAHEVAHQWWGVGVDFRDYRDQWLSEGFSHYSAALFALSGLDDEDKFEDMLDAWQLDVLGKVNVGQGNGQHYGFSPEAIRRSEGHRSGPLAVGYRLRSAETPADYRLLVYEKGAFVLHMLRTMLMDLETGDDTRFRDLMRGFARDHQREAASTDAFEAAVTRAFGEPMDWFFDQWVYGVDVPTYRPDLTTSRLIDQNDPYVLHGTIRQEDVSNRFRMPVPILVRFKDRPPMVRRVWVDGESVEVEIPLPAEPSEVEFNYRHGVLAQVR